MSGLIFHKVGLADKKEFDKYAYSMYMDTCDCSFANVYIWAEVYNTEVAFTENAAIVRYTIDNKFYYAYPIAADSAKRAYAVSEILKTSEKIRFIGISEAAKEELIKYFPSTFEIDENRDIFDYVYEREKLSTLKGKQFAAKRNHIHRFEDNGQWQYEELDKTNLKECFELELNWIKAQEKQDSKASILAEKNALMCAIDSFYELSLFGGAIRQKGRIVAFCIAEKLNDDTCVVHFEKAYSEIQGAFQIINQQFAAHHFEYSFINREDDIGDLGLRKAKLSYRPHHLVKKYSAVKSEFTYAVKEDLDEVITVWAKCFGDSKEYVAEFFNALYRENNVLLYRKNGKILSMACLLSCTITESDCVKDALYIYALCTSPDMRDHGYASELVAHIKNKYSCPVVLCLGNPGLEAFYEKNGFTTYSERVDFKENVVIYDIKENDGSTVEEINSVTEDFINDYKINRNEYLKNETYVLGRVCTSFVSWDEEYLRFAINDHLRAGGRIVRYNSGYLMFFVEECTLRVIESTVSEEDIHKLLRILAGKYKASNVVFRLEKCMIYDKNHGRSADGGGYLSITLG